VSPREARSALGPLRGEAAECGRAGSRMRPTGGGERQKIWRVHAYDLRGLQPLDIPQNGQRFVWKSLDKNSLDLEKLQKSLGGRPHSAAFARPPRRRRHSIAAAFRMHTIVASAGAELRLRIRCGRSQRWRRVSPARGVWPKSPTSTKEFAVENRKACRTPRQRVGCGEHDGKNRRG
jgi:hypothetical protein